VATLAGSACAAPAVGIKAVAVIESASGMVAVERRPGAKKAPATVGMDLPEGAMVTTAKSGRVTVRFGSSDRVQIAGGSQIWLAQVKGAKAGRTQTLIALVSGGMRATVAGSAPTFAVVAGSTIGTAQEATFEMLAPPAGATGGTVEVRCTAGAVGVGVISADEDLAVYKVASAKTTPLEAGTQVAASVSTGKLEPGRPAPATPLVDVAGGAAVATAATRPAVAATPAVAAGAATAAAAAGASAAAGGAAPAVATDTAPAVATAPAAASDMPEVVATPVGGGPPSAAERAAASAPPTKPVAPAKPAPEPAAAAPVVTVKPAAPVTAAVGASPGLGTIETAVGDVRVRLRPGIPAQKATVGLKLGEGAVVRTGPTGRCFIRFGVTDLVRISPNSELWLAQLRAPKAGKTVTVLQLLLGRARAMLRRNGVASGQFDFVIAAGTAVAAVKGTDFEVSFPKADGPVNVRVDDGVVMMGGISSWDVAEVVNMVGAMARGAAGRPVAEGFAIAVDSATGAMQSPRASVPRTNLEVVSSAGQVTVVTGGKTVRAWPGDEVPPGGKIIVSGGAAVFAAPKEAVEAGAGAQFSYQVQIAPATAGGPAEVRTTVTAGPASRAPVIVDTGTRTTTLAAGQSAVTVGGGELAAATARAATRAALAGPAKTEAETPAAPIVVASADMGSDEPMPELPSLASGAPMVAAQSGGSLPPPPPDTFNQDVLVISPSAPR
ncbi:MAG: FecR family protein, partial [Candidatus Coatesbacteria bacterium]